MWRKTLKITTWILGGLVGIPIAAYVAAVLINSHDEEPSADAVRLTASYEALAPVAESDNAFIYVLGFNAPVSENPRDVGRARLTWLQRNDAPFDPTADPLAAPLDYILTYPEVARFRLACDSYGPECLRAFPTVDALFEQWMAAQPWLLERYRQLIVHSAWRELVPTDITLPLPSYSGVMHGQRLFLLQAKVLADAGDTEAAAELLASDLRFWRMVLESSDLLVTKMIATAAVQRHFEWGSHALRSSPADRALAAAPPEWRAPLTAAELSLRRTLAGEWMYFSTNLMTLRGDFADDESLGARVSNKLTFALFQRQDTLNRYSTYFTQLGATLDAPLLGYAAVADAASTLAERTASEAFPPASLYNLVGAVLLGTAGPADYGDYARRVADLEGIRRAALATITLRAANLPTSDLAAALAASPLRNPYDDQPLRWDESAQAVVFVGLEPGTRGEHRLYY